MKLRRTIILVHKWLALVAGVFWAIAAMSGGVLVFGTEINRLFNSGRFETTAGELPPGGLDRALTENFPGETVSSMAWQHEDHVFRVTLQGENSRRLVFLDAGTGGEIRNIRRQIPIVSGFGRLHTTLLAGRYGHWLVTATSAAAIISMLTGLYLWWPGIRTFARGFAVRFRRGTYLLSYDLHQMLGATTFVLLFILTATGVVMGTPGATPAIARALLPEDAPPTAVTVPAQEAPQPESPPGIEQLVAAAEQATGGRIVSIVFPAGEPDRADVRVRLPDQDDEQTTRVVLSRADGGVLDVFDSSRLTREQRMVGFIGTWHTVRFDNLFVRILFSAASILGGVIAATGLTVWWMRRGRKRRSQASRAAGATA